MDFNPLHEPGQGNQGFRACNGYRYEFHIGKGASLADQAVYRVEFKNTLNPAPAPSPTDGGGGGSRADQAVSRVESKNPLTRAPAPSPTDGVGGGNELLWQLTGGTETM